MDVLEIKNITYRYTNSSEKILSSINQKFQLGKFYAIIGKSGAGKSTLLSLLAGLDKPQTGKVLFKNNNIEEKGYSNHRKNNISLVFQNYNLIDYLSPIENIRLVNKKASEGILIELGLDEKQIKRNIMKLSGGQQQRVAIARALVSEAPIILADEPTGNLDRATAGEIIEMLKKLAKERNKCVIVVTHSKEVADAADVILELSGKKLKQVKSLPKGYDVTCGNITVKLGLSAHNKLQKQILEEFVPNFASGAELLYIGDTSDRTLQRDDKRLSELGIKILEDTSKLPDIILYDSDKNRIIYVEAYSSTGEFNKDRVDYINTYCSYKNDIEVAFVTAFATTKKMLQVYPKIAWDTEIWIAEEATHLTHKNGDRFMGRNPEEFL